MSLASGHPENLQRRGAGHVQQDLKDKVAMMNRILKALEQDYFVLMAQPIRGIRGDNYHEVLLRMKGESGESDGAQRVPAGGARVWAVHARGSVGH